MFSLMSYPIASHIADFFITISESDYKLHQYLVSRKRPMGGAPYKSAKEEGGRSFECFHI